MARLPGIYPVGIPVNLIQCGNNRQSCFAAKADYVAYLGWLREYSEKFSVDIQAWVLMKGMALGNERFKDEVEALTDRRLKPKKVGRLVGCRKKKLNDL